MLDRHTHFSITPKGFILKCSGKKAEPSHENYPFLKLVRELQ